MLGIEPAPNIITQMQLVAEKRQELSLAQSTVLVQCIGTLQRTGCGETRALSPGQYPPS